MVEFKYEMEDKELLEMMERVVAERTAKEQEQIELEIKCQAAQYRAHVMQIRRGLRMLEHVALFASGALTAVGLMVLLLMDPTAESVWTGVLMLVGGAAFKLGQRLIATVRKEVGAK